MKNPGRQTRTLDFRSECRCVLWRHTGLYDVNFDIYQGMTVAVVGESGSGKSTTARCITGLLPPTKGEVQFKGETLPADYRNRTKDQLRQAQMIYRWRIRR